MEINYLVVGLCSVLAMVFGVVWYGPLFGEKRMKLANIQKEDMDKDALRLSMAQGFVATLLSNFFIALLLMIADVETLTGAVKLAVVLSFASAIPGALHGVAWEKQPLGLFFLNSLHALVNFSLAAVVIQFIA